MSWEGVLYSRGHIAGLSEVRRRVATREFGQLELLYVNIIMVS